MSLINQENTLCFQDPKIRLSNVLFAANTSLHNRQGQDLSENINRDGVTFEELQTKIAQFNKDPNSCGQICNDTSQIFRNLPRNSESFCQICDDTLQIFRNVKTKEDFDKFDTDKDKQLTMADFTEKNPLENILPINCVPGDPKNKPTRFDEFKYK
jgi:hypothetical protein